MITVNFEDTFDPVSIENDLSQMTFNSPQIDGTNQLILVRIDPHPDPYLPNVYNLGFGPPDESGDFYDDIRLQHAQINKSIFYRAISRVDLFTDKSGINFGGRRF